MQLIEAKIYSNVQIEYDRGSIPNGDTYIIPIGRSPLPIDDSASIVSGWPLYEMYPNMPYDSRYDINVTMLLEDLSSGEVSIERLPTTLIQHRDQFYSFEHNFRISNLLFTWDLLAPSGSIRLGDDQSIGTFGDDSIPHSDSYYSLDLGTDLNNPADADVNNHYIIKYGILDRGYGRAKHGWFYADTAGDWSWSIDGYDAVELSVNDAVLASRYIDGDPVGIGTLYGSINLSIGWHHMFAYTSYRSNSSYPLVSFKRPGDASWRTLVTDQGDGMIWSNARIIPRNIRFSYNAGDITAILSYSDAEEINLTFDSSLLHSGNMKTDLKSIPRYKHYYWNDWREYNRPKYLSPRNLPPILKNMRGIMTYVPTVEVLFYSQYSYIDYTPKFLVRSRSGNGAWYRWDGSAFQLVSVSSVSDLNGYGNTIFELNSLTDADWNLLMQMDDKAIELMFTEEPPLALASNRRLLGNPTEAEFMLSVKNQLQSDIRVEKRTI